MITTKATKQDPKETEPHRWNPEKSGAVAQSHLASSCDQRDVRNVSPRGSPLESWSPEFLEGADSFGPHCCWAAVCGPQMRGMTHRTCVMSSCVLAAVRTVGDITLQTHSDPIEPWQCKRSSSERKAQKHGSNSPCWVSEDRTDPTWCCYSVLMGRPAWLLKGAGSACGGWACVSFFTQGSGVVTSCGPVETVHQNNARPPLSSIYPADSLHPWARAVTSVSSALSGHCSWGAPTSLLSSLGRLQTGCHGGFGLMSSSPFSGSPFCPACCFFPERWFSQIVVDPAELVHLLSYG